MTWKVYWENLKPHKPQFMRHKYQDKKLEYPSIYNLCSEHFGRADLLSTLISMWNIESNISLKLYNTFNIAVKAKYFAEFNTKQDLIDLLRTERHKHQSYLILGGGSNILFTKDFDGIIFKNNIKYMNILSEDIENVIVEIGAGIIWHDFVLWSVRKHLSGIENLALIPGTVGASPVQNIGAYGMEVKDVIIKINTVEIGSLKDCMFSNPDCHFGYRDSIFKEELKSKHVITSVVFKLGKSPLNITTYGRIQQELDDMKSPASPVTICQAVMNIRQRKLPDPNILGNCGSFFKNIVISNKQFEELKTKFPAINGYVISEKSVKIAVGWLIDHLGWTGYRKGDVGVHKNQALVLVNYGNATGTEILQLATEIHKSVFDTFGIKIQTEVNII